MKCVLILEDEPFIAMDLRLALEDRDIDAIATTTCDEALEVLNGRSIEGAILDVNLGQGKTCEAVALELTKRNIPFILNTGDLDRSGEMLRRIEAPVVAKPTPSEIVVDCLLTHRAAA